LKKVLLVILLIAVISAFGCGKKNKTVTITTPEGKEITTTTSPEGRVMSIQTK